MTAPHKDDRLYLVHIIETLRRIMRYTRSGREAFLSDELIQDGVYRNFLVIGEAAKRVSESTRRLARNTGLSRTRLRQLESILEA